MTTSASAASWVGGGGAGAAPSCKLSLAVPPASCVRVSSATAGSVPSERRAARCAAVSSGYSDSESSSRGAASLDAPSLDDPSLRSASESSTAPRRGGVRPLPAGDAFFCFGDVGSVSLLRDVLALASLDAAALDTPAAMDDAPPPPLRGGWGAPESALVVRFVPAIAPQSSADGSVMLVCATLDVASLDVTCSWTAAVAAAVHGVTDAVGMTMEGRRHVKSSPIGRAVATEESEGALGGHVSFPR